MTVLFTEEEKIELDLPLYIFRDGYNQLLSYFISEENADTSVRLTGAPTTEEIRLLEQKLLEENIQYCITNFGASYTSDTYVEIGAALDTIMSEARINYIQGIIDDVGLQEAKDQWRRSGGDDVVNEMNELYHAVGK